jgi:hypothetical protein
MCIMRPVIETEPTKSGMQGLFADNPAQIYLLKVMNV